MVNYSWPGNIRELISKVKRATALADTPILTCEDLDLPNNNAENETAAIDWQAGFSLRSIKTSAETQAIEQALNLSHNNMTETSKLLGITRPTLYSLIEKYHIQVQH